MDTRKLLIADAAEDFRLALADALQGTYCVHVCQDGKDALALLHSFHPDILVLDLMLPELDGISLLQSAVDAGIHPMVLATTRFVSDYVLDAMDRFGVEYLMVKPCDIQAAAARISDLSQRLRQPFSLQPDHRVSVTNLLLALGVPTKLRGYTYLREAVLLMARNPGQSITKELYPAVAAACDSAASHVERSIRSAITAAWEHRDDRYWQQYFRTGADGILPRPSNATFISRLADSLRMNTDVFPGRTDTDKNQQ